MKNLYLFDIDGTLVNINNEVHLPSYKMDYKNVINRDVPDGVIVGTFGMTEIEIHRIILAYLAIPYDEGIVSKIEAMHLSNFGKALKEYLKHTPKIKPLEGVVEFLSYLKRNGEYLSIVTGNLEKNAKLILKKSGLEGFFPIRSYDDGKSKKEQIFQRAIDEARRMRYDFNRVVVIGDTTRDIEAGKYVNAYVVAVATGSDSISKLTEKIKILGYENSSIAVPSLKDYKRFQKLWNNHSPKNPALSASNFHASGILPLLL